MAIHDLLFNADHLTWIKIFCARDKWKKQIFMIFMSFAQYLKAQLSKLYNVKYMIPSTQISYWAVKFCLSLVQMKEKMVLSCLILKQNSFKPLKQSIYSHLQQKLFKCFRQFEKKAFRKNSKAKRGNCFDREAATRRVLWKKLYL